MKKNIKAAGTRFEYRIRNELERSGWRVFRSAGSRTVGDLVAIHKIRPLTAVIQAKASNKPNLSKKETEELLQIHNEIVAEVLVICREDRTHNLKYYQFIGDKLKETGRPPWLG